MDELPDTQSQCDSYIESSQEDQVGQIRRPWGRLVSCIPTLMSIDLFEPCYTFGRAPTCNIFVEKSHFGAQASILNLSKEHFKLTKDNDDLIYLTDLSKNGTFINNAKVGKKNNHIIYNDDVIAVGHPNYRVYSFSCDINREDNEYPVEMKRKYFISKKLGQGAFGEVRLAHNKRSFEKFAIKKVLKASSNVSSVVGRTCPLEKMKTEIEILTSFSYSFILKMFDIFETDREVYLVLEYMPGGELTSRMLSTRPFPEAEVKYVFYQILLAVRYLHVNGVTHRDLKPENVLMCSETEYPRIKVSDFGLSKIMDETSLMETVCGTIHYAAPEVLNYRYESYNNKVDIWSLGVILFYMLSKRQPFAGTEQDAIARNILSGTISWGIKEWRGISNSAKDLIRKLLVVDPERRASVADIFKHDWIDKDYDTRYRVESMLSQNFDETDSSEELSAPKRPRLCSVGGDST